MSTHIRESLSLKPFAVEGARRPGAKGIAPGAGQEETDPEWYPV